MNFEDEAAKLRKKLGIWDDRPRFLGIFQIYDIPQATIDKAPWYGVGDHLQSCKECAAGGGVQHPKIHAIFAYVRLGSTILSVSWPTWWDELFS